MGMYTELIFGARLKTYTPENVINALKYMIGETKERPIDFPFSTERADYLLRSGSYYFGVNQPVSSLRRDNPSGLWVLSTRSNIKNYDNDIETFLEWVKPYIESGSGSKDMYAIVIYEEQSEPTIYYLHSDINER
jgi:hypothetical protein